MPNRNASPFNTTGDADTFNGGQGFSRDAKSDLFLLAVTNFVGEQTFYESGQNRDNRFRSLIHAVVAQDPTFVADMIPWLRDVAQMRTASAVMAAEYHRGLHLAGYPKGAPSTALVMQSACSRADEPAEILAYWLATYGRPVPIALRRGIAVAASKQYTERNVLKYDGQSRSLRMGDVIELTRPTPNSTEQSELFKYLLTRRHRTEDEANDQITPGQLPMIRAAHALEKTPVDDRRSVTSERLAEGGFTWERLAGWLPGGMDAAAWELAIPNMGYMALLRNLNNFDKAKISQEAYDYVRTKIADRVEVAKSRQFPYRFFTAYKTLQTHRWNDALESALDASVANIPVFDGSTLVLVDLSGSMIYPINNRTTVMRHEVGALFGAALALKSNADVSVFATTSAPVRFDQHASVLRLVDKIVNSPIRGGTDIWGAVDREWHGHDRIVIFTDMQTGGGVSPTANKVQFIHGFNLAGYGVTTIDSAKNGRFEYGGFTDNMMKMMPLLEQMKDGIANWPWEK